MPFFEFTQNNSGGHFDMDDNVSVYVVIEAPNADAANDKAETLGLYWNGVDSGTDCNCCGDRWNKVYGEGDLVPTIYGQDVSGGIIGGIIKWNEDGPEGYIYYADGTKVALYGEGNKYQSKVSNSVKVPAKLTAKPKTMTELWAMSQPTEQNEDDEEDE